jgi:hypothetical protein
MPAAWHVKNDQRDAGMTFAVVTLLVVAVLLAAEIRWLAR